MIRYGIILATSVAILSTPLTNRLQARTDATVGAGKRWLDHHTGLMFKSENGEIADVLIYWSIPATSIAIGSGLSHSVFASAEGERAEVTEAWGAARLQAEVDRWSYGGWMRAVIWSDGKVTGQDRFIDQNYNYEIQFRTYGVLLGFTTGYRLFGRTDATLDLSYGLQSARVNGGRLHYRDDHRDILGANPVLMQSRSIMMGLRQTFF